MRKCVKGSDNVTGSVIPVQNKHADKAPDCTRQPLNYQKFLGGEAPIPPLTVHAWEELTPCHTLSRVNAWPASFSPSTAFLTSLVIC